MLHIVTRSRFPTNKYYLFVREVRLVVAFLCLAVVNQELPDGRLERAHPALNTRCLLHRVPKVSGDPAFPFARGPLLPRQIRLVLNLLPEPRIPMLRNVVRDMVGLIPGTRSPVARQRRFDEGDIGEARCIRLEISQCSQSLPGLLEEAEHKGRKKEANPCPTAAAVDSPLCPSAAPRGASSSHGAAARGARA